MKQLRIPDGIKGMVHPVGGPYTTMVSLLFEQNERTVDDVRHLLEFCGIGTSADIVDYGCGLGRWLWALSGVCQSATGVDCEAEYVEVVNAISATNQIHNIRAIQAFDLRGLGDACADLVIASGTLPLLSGQLWHDFFNEAPRILRPGGAILFNTFTIEFAADQMLAGEGLRYLRSHGPRFALDRQIGWCLQWYRGITARNIRPTAKKTYYVVSPKVVESFVREKGFLITKSHSELTRSTGLGSAEFTPTGSSGRAHRHWVLAVRR